MTLKKSFSYRPYWMGFAILYVMLFHSGFEFNNYYLNSIKRVGYCGVDIFIFAAGIGNYYSYLRDKSPLNFLKRRIIRLGPSYITFIAVWLIYRIYFCNADFGIIIGNLFGIQGFTNNGGEFNWYLPLIILCYLLTPYLATFVEEKRFKYNCTLFVVFIILSSVFWNDTKFIIITSRIPIFFMGMLFAKYDKMTISKRTMAVLGIAFIIGFLFLHFSFGSYTDYLWTRALYWYPFILIVPFACVMISKLTALIQSSKKMSIVFTPILSLLKTSGECSFELFLIHIFLFEVAEMFVGRYKINNTALVYCLAIAISLVCAIQLKRLSDYLREKMTSG